MKNVPRYLPEVVHFAVDERLVLPFDVVDVPEVAGVEVLLHNEAQKAVVWGVSWSGEKRNRNLKTVQKLVYVNLQIANSE